MGRCVIALFLIFSVVYAKNEMYEGHSLYEVTVKDLEEAKLVNEIEHELQVDIWSHVLPSRPGQVLVAKEKKAAIQKAFDDAGIEYKIVVENIKELIDLEEEKLSKAAKKPKPENRASAGLSFDRIYTYEEVNEYLEELAAAYPHLVTLETAGKSFEGRDINYIKISTTNFQDTSKPIVMVESLIHAREWVALPSTLYAIHKLLIDVTDLDLVTNIDWIILPVVNPDGYVFSHNTNRFWRKNRATGYMVTNFCQGVDLNRNFDVHWGVASSALVCAEDFRGRSAFSEPESIAVRDILAQYADRMELFLDIHSFGSMILWPYGNAQMPTNALQQNLLGVQMANAIDAVKLPHNINYIVGNTAMTIYRATGSANDYGHLVGVPYSYCFELPAHRSSSTTLNGFLVDDDFIEQAGYETWEGIKVGARYVVDNYRRKMAAAAAAAAA